MHTKFSHTFEGVYLYKEDYYSDARGCTYTTYNETYGLPKFVLDKVICGTAGCVRGFHGDFYTYKLITCLWGSFDLALLDMRRGPTFKQIEYIPFKANQTCILVPPGVFNCHLGHEDYLLHYKWSHQYDLSAQDTISYKEAFNLPNLIASQRDQTAKTLQEYLSEKS